MLKRILIGLLVILGIALITVLALDAVFGWNRLGGPPGDALTMACSAPIEPCR